MCVDELKIECVFKYQMNTYAWIIDIKLPHEVKNQRVLTIEYGTGI